MTTDSELLLQDILLLQGESTLVAYCLAIALKDQRWDHNLYYSVILLAHTARRVCPHLKEDPSETV